MSAAIREVRLGQFKGKWYVVRENGGLDEFGNEEHLYLHPDGVWRNSMMHTEGDQVFRDRLTGYFGTREQAVAALAKQEKV